MTNEELLSEFKAALKSEITEVKAELNKRINALETRMNSLESQMIKMDLDVTPLTHQATQDLYFPPKQK